MATSFRGIESKHEHAAQKVARDTRPLGTRVAEFLSKPATTFILSGTGIATIFIFPLVADIVFVFCAGLFIFAFTRKHVLPFRLPRSSKALDYNDLISGTVKPRKAGGISFIGNDRMTGEELWFTNDDLRTHILIFGSTGSGKTEMLISIAFNSLIHGSGFIYVDGKGDNSLFAKVFSMVRSMGREDDMLLINFMTGARDIIGPQENRLSNTMNPFSSGSSSMISQLVISLMDAASSGSTSGDMWKGRAMNFVESLMKILCAMRDAGYILLDANTIRDYFILERLESIVVDKKFPIGDAGYMVPLEDMPQEVLDPLKNYVLNLPGYNPKKKGDQAGEVREQHGFITMQLTRVFGSLADTYGHIIRTNLAEVDLKDVVLNRRILVVLLPALEKSPEELGNLGKIIVASLKAMMASGLGDTVEGDYRDVVLSKPTNAPSPYVCIMDEYGYYAVPGFAVVPAQARSLGFSAVFAGQDLPAFQKASKEEAASIGANCNIKICMKLEDPQETWEYFNKVAGETYVTNVSGFQMNAGSVSMNYLDTKSASVDRRQRIEILDLKDQREGEFHIFFKSTIVRAESFYANPKPVKKMRINHFLKVEPPSDLELANLDKRLKRFSQVFTQQQVNIPMAVANEDIGVLTHALENIEGLRPFERGIAGLIAILEHEVARQRELSAPYEGEQLTKQMSAFTRIEVTPLVEQMIGSENVELFSLPLIRRGSTMEEIKHIERLSGKTFEQAAKVAADMIANIEDVTKFPPEVLFSIDKQQTLDDINAVIKLLGGTPVGGGGGSSGPGGVASIADQTSIAGLNDLPALDDFPELPELPEASAVPVGKTLDKAEQEDAKIAGETSEIAGVETTQEETTGKAAQVEKKEQIDYSAALDLPSTTIAKLPELPSLDELEALLNEDSSAFDDKQIDDDLSIAARSVQDKPAGDAADSTTDKPDDESDGD